MKNFRFEAPVLAPGRFTKYEKNPAPWGAGFSHVVPPKFNSLELMEPNTVALYGNNGPTRGPILSQGWI